MGLFGGHKRIRGKVISTTPLMGTMRIEVEFVKARADDIFTGTADYGRLKGKIVSLTVEKIDTRKEEIRTLRAERTKKRKAIREDKKKP